MRMSIVFRVGLVGWLIAAALRSAGHATEPAVDFQVQLDVALQELSPDYCWFHPRVASVPNLGKDGDPLVVLTLQKHLGASDHYSGLYYMTSKDLGVTWTKPVLPKPLEWRATGLAVASDINAFSRQPSAGFDSRVARFSRRCHFDRNHRAG